MCCRVYRNILLVLAGCGVVVFVDGEAMNQMWMFVLAPIIGALLVALAWKALSNKGDKK